MRMISDDAVSTDRTVTTLVSHMVTLSDLTSSLRVVDSAYGRGRLISRSSQQLCKHWLKTSGRAAAQRGNGAGLASSRQTATDASGEQQITARRLMCVRNAKPVPGQKRRRRLVAAPGWKLWRSLGCVEDGGELMSDAKQRV